VTRFPFSFPPPPLNGLNRLTARNLEYRTSAATAPPASPFFHCSISQLRRGHLVPPPLRFLALMVLKREFLKLGRPASSSPADPCRGFVIERPRNRISPCCGTTSLSGLACFFPEVYRFNPIAVWPLRISPSMISPPHRE